MRSIYQLVCKETQNPSSIANDIYKAQSSESFNWKETSLIKNKEGKKYSIIHSKNER